MSTHAAAAFSSNSFYEAPKQRLSCKPRLQDLQDETGDEQETTRRLHEGCKPPHTKNLKGYAGKPPAVQA